MTTWVHEIQIKSTGYQGAPGWTNLYFELDAVEADTAPSFGAAHVLLQSLAGTVPNTWSGQIQPTGRILLAESGTLANFSTAPTADQPPVPGIGSGGYGAGVAGVCLAWQTATVNRGRVVRGRTFVVPVSSAIFESNGTITAEALTGFTNMGNTLIASNTGFCIWSRPRLGAGGLTCPVTSVRITDQAAVLTSRRS